MSQTTVDSTPVVVHVYAERAPREASNARRDWLTALDVHGQCAVETIGDVYRALARIGRDHDRAVRAVVVCTDELTPAELEFFELLRRLRRDVALGVYGTGRSRLDRCVALGAQEVHSDAALRELIGFVDRPDEGACHSGRATQAPLAFEIEPARTTPPPVIVDEGDEDEIEDSLETADPAPGAIRVPWLNYEGGPNRAAPPRSPQSAESDRPAQASSHTARVPYEPLLTDEELRALIGDDFVSLGPERGGRDADEADDEEGAG